MTTHVLIPFHDGAQSTHDVQYGHHPQRWMLVRPDDVVSVFQREYYVNGEADHRGWAVPHSVVVFQVRERGFYFAACDGACFRRLLNATWEAA